MLVVVAVETDRIHADVRMLDVVRLETMLALQLLDAVDNGVIVAAARIRLVIDAR